MTCLANLARYYSSIMEIIAYPTTLTIEVCFIRRNTDLIPLSGKEPMYEVVASNEETGIIMLLNGHGFKLIPNALLICKRSLHHSILSEKLLFIIDSD